MHFRSSLKLIIPAALLALAAGCKQDAQPNGKGMPPSAVTVVTVEAREVPVSYEYTAQTAGYREVEVRGRVTGLLLRRNYRPSLRNDHFVVGLQG